MKLAIFFLFLVVLMIFVFASAALVYHFIKFRFSKSHHKLILSIFITGSIILLFFELFLFFSINWDVLMSSMEGRINIQTDQIIQYQYPF